MKLVLLLTLTTTLLCGDLPRTHFFRITQTDGLSVNQVQAVARDEWGYLWIGTSNGLNRYDGSNFIVHRPEPETPDRLSDSNCYALLYDAARKSLWIGTHGGGLNRYHIPSDHFEQVPIQPQKNRLPGTEDIFALLSDRSGRIWFGGSCGLQVIHRGQSNPEFIPLGPRNQTQDPRPCPVTALAVNSRGRVFIGTEQGVWTSLGNEAPFPVVVPGEAQLQRCIWSLCAGDEGDLWVGCEGGALFHLTADFRIADHFQHSGSNDFPTEGINALCRDRSQRLWIGTYGGGLLCLNPNSRSPQAFHARQDNPFSLPDEQINCLFQDPKGSIWIGTDNGLCRYEPELERVIHLGRDEPARRRLTHPDIVTLAELPQGIWLGTSDGRINRIRHQADNPGIYAAEPARDLGCGSLTKLVADRHNHLWCAAETGLLELDADGQLLKRFTPSPDTDRGMPDSTIITLMADRQDRLWIGSTARGSVCCRSEPKLLPASPGKFCPPSRSGPSWRTIGDASGWVPGTVFSSLDPICSGWTPSPGHPGRAAWAATGSPPSWRTAVDASGWGPPGRGSISA